MQYGLETPLEGDDYKLVKGSAWWPFGRKYQLLNALEYDHPRLTSMGIKIPAGYVWNGASFLPMREDDPVAIPTLIHDYLYGRNYATKGAADFIFYELMSQYGVSLKRRLGYRIGLNYMWFTAWASFRGIRGYSLAAIGLVQFWAQSLLLWYFVPYFDTLIKWGFLAIL